MSTKIYNAYQLKRTPPDKLLSALTEIRRDYINYAKKDMWEHLKPEKIGGVLSMDQFSQLFVEVEKKNFYSQLNYKASVVAYFYKRRTYLQFFGIDEFNYEHLRMLHTAFDENLLDFHYQNQSDKPDEVSDREWEHRRKTWDGIFRNSDIPSASGFVYDFFSHRDIFDLTIHYIRQLHTTKKNVEKMKELNGVDVSNQF